MSNKKFFNLCFKIASVWSLFGIVAFVQTPVFVQSAMGEAPPSAIAPDNTLGVENSKVVTNFNLNGLPVEVITGGATRGINLFHSFREFNVSEGRGAYFLSPSADIQNILARVTGSNRSEILGKLGTSGNSQPNLFLINPNGIIFGKNASLDVQGSFIATTANSIQFGSQGIFSATNPQVLPLLTINPNALLFNQINQNATIQNNSIAPAGKDPAGIDIFGLRVPDGKSLLLVGGNVSMDRGWAIANGGRIELGGLTEAGSIGIQSNGDNVSLNFPNGVQRGDISLNNGAIVGVIGGGSGSIAANARNLEILAGSQFFAGIGSGLGTVNTQAGDITVDATEQIKLAGTDSLIFNSVQSQAVGNAGNITLKAGSLEVTDGAQINSFTRGRGNAGNITIQAKDAVSLDGVGLLSSGVDSDAVGNAGKIDITTGSLSLTNGAEIISLTNGQGNAGNITIQAKDAVTFDGFQFFNDKSSFFTVLLSNVEAGAIGNGGNIDITAGSLSLTNGGQLLVGVDEKTNTLPGGQGTAGNVNINVRDAFTISGTNSRISGGLGAGSVGRGGDIKVQAGNVFVKDGGEIAAFSDGKGDAGNISITSRNLVSLDKSVVANLVLSREAIGNAGKIDITTGSLLLTNGAQINSSTRGQGNAGNITIQAKDAVTFDGFQFFDNKNSIAYTGILSDINAGAVGNGGNIDITAGSLSLTNGGQLLVGVDEKTNTLPGGQGIGGTVNINVRDAFTISGTDSKIIGSLGTGATGLSGNINIQASNIFVRDGAQINSFTRGQGNAGNITIQAKDVVIFDGTDNNGNKSGLFSIVGDDAIGNGGTVSITSGSLSLNNGGSLGIYVSDASDVLQGKKATGGTANIDVRDAFTISGEGSNIFASLGSGVVGIGGDVIIKAGNLSIQNAGEISSNNYGKGNAGNIDITTGSLNLANRAGIFADTYGEGNGGNITVEAKDLVEVLSDSHLDSDVEQFARGNAGDITINTGRLIVRNSQIGPSVFGEGNAGNFTIIASKSVELSGQLNKREGDTSQEGSVGFPGGLLTQIDVLGKGKAGNLTIETSRLSVSDGSKIQAATFGDGDAGNIFIRADEIDLFETEKPNFYSTGIFAGVQTDGRIEAGIIDPRNGIPPKGQGGNLTIATRKLSVRDGAEVFVQTTGEGDAGKIFIRAGESVNVTGVSTGSLERQRTSKITAGASQTSTGNGGSLTIETPLLNVTDGGFISSTSEGTGNAGIMTINADRIRLDNQASLNTNTRSPNKDPNREQATINLNTQNLTLRRNSNITTNATGENVIGGNINIDTDLLIALENSHISANSGNSRGGQVRINAQGVFVGTQPSDVSKYITATSGVGLSGTVNVNSPDNSAIQNNLTELPTNAIDTNALIANSCIARANKKQENSFIITGGGALPNRPGDVSMSNYSTGRVRGVNNENTSRPWKKGDPILEPTGVYRLSNGQLVMSRECQNN
ncbi:MAG: filamentous hemagglutinin N-terminal domain-containing protein [Nostoc sp.]